MEYLTLAYFSVKLPFSLPVSFKRALVNLHPGFFYCAATGLLIIALLTTLKTWIDFCYIFLSATDPRAAASYIYIIIHTKKKKKKYMHQISMQL